MWCTAAKNCVYGFPRLHTGAIYAEGSTVHISGETSFVNNSATSDIQLNTGGGQIVEHMEMSNR